MTSSQQSIDARNAEFWNELCGSELARHIGISDHSLASLRAFDRAYLQHYPYLLECVPVATMRGKRVLEIGLGYGTLGQRIVEAGAHYHGLDIAEGPVRMMEHRLRMQALAGTVNRGSVLTCPFPDESFDCVVAIGCFHHTGDAGRAVDETWRVLRRGGRAYVMVYNKFSLRRWWRWPLATALALARRGAAADDPSRPAPRDQRKAYDANLAGQAAPETRFFSIAELRQVFRRYSSFQARKENCDPIVVRRRRIVARERALPIIGPVAGLDIYISAIK